jgi:hypothetical protein
MELPMPSVEHRAQAQRFMDRCRALTAGKAAPSEAATRFIRVAKSLAKENRLPPAKSRPVAARGPGESAAR